MALQVRLPAVAVLCAGVLLTSPALGAEAASPNDTARFLAGMEPSSGSPLAPLAQDRVWQQYATHLNTAWADLEQRQLSNIRAWSSANLAARRPVTYYLFSGPDFLYVDAFFPGSSTYILAGLEPIGPLPDVAKLRPGSLPAELSSVRNTLGTVLRMSYFITREMNTDLHAGQLRGTLPILYVFLARAGKTIREVSFVSLAPDGSLQPDTNAKGVTRGVKIVFSGSGGRVQTLYYFKTDLSNAGVRNSGFLQFCAQFGIGDIFIKAASYLLHGAPFSAVREFLLGHGASVVQDDTGIPVTYFQKGGWQLHPFGDYVGPIPMFRGHYQPKLDELFERSDAQPIAFGVGYRWRANESHVLLAVNKEAQAARIGWWPVAPKLATPKDASFPGQAATPAPRPGMSKVKATTPKQAPLPAPEAPSAWRLLLLGGLVGSVLAAVFGPGTLASVLGFVLQLGLIGGLVWLGVTLVRNRNTTQPATPPSS